MYARSAGLGAVAPVSDWVNQTVWTGTLQEAWGDLRFSTVGLNCGLNIPPDLVEGMRGAVGHCVRIEGVWEAAGRIRVQGWAILPDGAEFTQGGVTYTCGDFKPKVAQGGVEVDPTPPVTSGGTVTTTDPIPAGVDPANVPANGPTTPDAGGASGGGYSAGGGGGYSGTGGGAGILQAGALPLFIGAGLLLALARKK